jgi:lysophospholipid acyltransferase (LPLAT)-like uncharacterized protein
MQLHGCRPIKIFLRTHKKQIAAFFLGHLIYYVMRILRMTMRVTIIGGEIPQAYHDRGEGLIGVFWHSRLFMPVFAYTGKGFNVLISDHGDGEIIATVMKKFGHKLVRGSSTKGGKKALMEMVRLAKDNCDIGITPDGPRGPAEVVKPGVATLASLTKRAVIPFAYSCSRAKRLSSWDRFMLPYPFSRAVFVWGEPLTCHEGESVEVLRHRIETALREITEQADGYFSAEKLEGHSPMAFSVIRSGSLKTPRNE